MKQKHLDERTEKATSIVASLPFTPDSTFTLAGIHFSFEDNHAVNIAYFTQEMLKKGFLASGGFYAMYAHTFEQVEQ